MKEDGIEALARVLEGLTEAAERVEAGESVDDVAEELWPSFQTAVSVAYGEMRARELEGYSDFLTERGERREAGE